MDDKAVDSAAVAVLSKVICESIRKWGIYAYRRRPG